MYYLFDTGIAGVVFPDLPEYHSGRFFCFQNQKEQEETKT
ncbi:hypothetical protein CK5_22190 [Blautia obeum A2-162]|uniref:Uncharacterized protein n=1 Tax=Blautia obeum A2-162 TaxID=657314 RepID=D4LS09_9FIRM|nr:hypothetical protein CK5_22190 [Blautia obeum A2-162]